MYYDPTPFVRKADKVFFPISRTVLFLSGIRLCSCAYSICPFPTLTCNKCYYGT